MKRVLTAVILIPLVLLVLFKAPMWLFTLVVGLVAIGAAWEYLGLVNAYGNIPVRKLTTGLIGFLFLSLAFAEGSFRFSRFLSALSLATILGILVGGPLLLLVTVMHTQELAKALPTASLSWMAIPYVALTLVCLILLRSNPAGVFYVLYLFIVVWSGDIFAYYVGRSIGKNKLAPRISPGKTWEGTFASLFGSTALGTLLFFYSAPVASLLANWNLGVDSPRFREFLPATKTSVFLSGILLSVGVNACAQLGDLVESMIKRGANVKDSGTLLPGHGGILDRIDALLFAVPVVYFYALSFYPDIHL